MSPWDSTNGKHLLEAQYKGFTLPPGKPELVIGQIHDDTDDVVRILIKGTKGKSLETAKLIASFSKGKDQGSVDIPLGTVYHDKEFSVDILTTKKGIKITFNGTKIVNYVKSGKRWYFKVGAYVLSNLKYDKKGAFGEIGFRAKITHS